MGSTKVKRPHATISHLEGQASERLTSVPTESQLPLRLPSIHTLGGRSSSLSSSCCSAILSASQERPRGGRAAAGTTLRAVDEDEPRLRNPKDERLLVLSSSVTAEARRTDPAPSWPGLELPLSASWSRSSSMVMVVGSEARCRESQARSAALMARRR